ncbi:hypothetical protein [Azomonas macrocytogenes]|uniref:hypothetical protein n=1 Tax=Azomonas macrocytogenes TaxID=69962 RepID=UPI003B8344E5
MPAEVAGRGFQRMMHHPLFRHYLEGGKRVSYGARVIAKGGCGPAPTARPSPIPGRMAC